MFPVEMVVLGVTIKMIPIRAMIRGKAEMPYIAFLIPLEATFRL